MPDYPNHPVRVGRMQSLAHVLGRDTDGHAKRPTLTGNYREPQLPWETRKQWLRQVNRLAADCTAKKESYPHKVTAVARALAFAGDVCKPSIEYIATQAGCVENTVKACIAWLEEHGALTWSHTARKHKSGRMVRSSNLYQLILDFAGATAMLARAMRAIWRERRPVTASKGNGCPGVLSLHTNPDAYAAMNRLAAISRQRSDQFNRQWLAARTL
jgi:hypothetical protein